MTTTPQAPTVALVTGAGLGLTERLLVRAGTSRVLGTTRDLAGDDRLLGVIGSLQPDRSGNFHSCDGQPIPQ